MFLKWVNESWKFCVMDGWKDNKALYVGFHGKFALQVKGISLSLVNKQCRGWKSQLGLFGVAAVI